MIEVKKVDVERGRGEKGRCKVARKERCPCMADQIYVLSIAAWRAEV
jgi:hypothetical protein